MNILYTAVAHATGDGRNGHVADDHGLIDTDVRIPEEMGGAGGAPNPELLFAAGYAACFHSALKVVGAGHDLTDSAVSASVGIGPDDSGGFGLAVELDVSIPKVDAVTAQALVEQAHQVCPYSNATRGNVEVQLTVV